MRSPRGTCPVRGHTGTAESTGRGADQWGRERPDQRAVLDAVGREVDNAVDDVLERVTLAELVRQYHERETFSYII